MAGTKAGGKKAGSTNKRRYGSDFYVTIGRHGGSKSKNGGFASEIIGKDGLTGRERAKLVGIKGGKATRKNG